MSRWFMMSKEHSRTVRTLDQINWRVSLNNKQLEDVLICSNCNQLGIYKYRENQNIYIECGTCRTRSVVVNCSDCGVRGEFLKNGELEELSWTCPYCNKHQKIDDDFYDNPYVVKMEGSNKKLKESNDIKNSMIELKVYYFIAFLLILIMTEIDNNDVALLRRAIVAFIMSFWIGFMIYDLRMFIKEKKKSRLELLMFSRLGLFHIVLTFMGSFIYVFIDVFFS